MELICHDFNRICRACRNESVDMRSIFEESTRFDEMLMACTSIQVEMDDGLPAKMCKFCINQLLVAFQFKQQCELTDSMLRTYADVNFKESESSVKQDSENSDSANYSLLQEGHWLCDELNNSKSESKSQVLKCPTCAKMFSTLDGLKCHQRMHTGNMFQCKLCDKKYTRMNHLHRHELSHSQPKMHVCKICNKSLTRFEHLKRHLITHVKEKPFPCKQCNRGFGRSEHLSKHMQKCKGEHTFVCEICNKSYMKEESLIAHMQVHEGKEMPVLPTLSSLDDVYQHYIETDYDENKVNDSEATAEDLEDYDFLEPQVDIEENEDCDNGKMESYAITENNTSKESLLDISPALPVKRKRGRPRKDQSQGKNAIKSEDHFACNMCDKVFSDFRMFERHERLHERLKTYQCTICDKEFSRSYHLKRHMSSHLSQKLVTCQFCKQNFSKQDYLFEHIKMHMEEENAKEQFGEMQCLNCGTKFETLDCLRDHKCLTNFS